MEFDLSITVTADLKEFDRLHTALAEALIARLEKQYSKRRMAEFFPAELFGVPDTELVGMDPKPSMMP